MPQTFAVSKHTTWRDCVFCAHAACSCWLGSIKRIFTSWEPEYIMKFHPPGTILYLPLRHTVTLERDTLTSVQNTGGRARSRGGCVNAYNISVRVYRSQRVTLRLLQAKRGGGSALNRNHDVSCRSWEVGDSEGSCKIPDGILLLLFDKIEPRLQLQQGASGPSSYTTVEKCNKISRSLQCVWVLITLCCKFIIRLGQQRLGTQREVNARLMVSLRQCCCRCTQRSCWTAPKHNLLL